MRSSKVTLTVNQVDIPLDRFVSVFIYSVISGMVAALSDGSEVKKLNLSISADDVSIKLNGDSIQLNRFVSEIIGNTVKGMVSSLKGVGRIESLSIDTTK